jgi:FkbH-like protein
VKLIEALELIGRPGVTAAPELKIFLACGFTPLHLQTFLAAHLRERLPERRISVSAGLFGDLCGNIERLEGDTVDFLAVVVEWSDLDPRLGLRTLGGWRPPQLDDIVESARRTAARLERGLAETSSRVPGIVCMPTLPLPPMFSTRPAQAGSLEIQLHQVVTSLMANLSEQSNLRIASAQFLDEASSPADRYDVKSDVRSGFPYSVPHASALAQLLASLIQNRSAKKGLITDLDDTLWDGILGEDGVDGISWHLDRHSHLHGLYQQFLASLAGSGVLVGVASKNDPALVNQAFQRNDLLLSSNDVFPFETHWSRKSESVQRILQAWNVSPDAVVFIDDSPMEVAEVKAAFPELECIVFPKDDHGGLWNLLKHLRDVFGKALLTPEDSLRLTSIRDSSIWRDRSQSRQASPDEFLKAAEAHIAFDSSQLNGDNRALELINKTNQFNLNGRRFSESEWRNFFIDPTAFLLTASYKDKYGSLGKIAVILGKTGGHKLCVNGWVMSCRAFSRRIEHQCLKYLFEAFGVDEISFDYQTTPRNGPLQAFFAEFVDSLPAAGVTLSRQQFAAKVRPLFHRVEGTVNV